MKVLYALLLIFCLIGCVTLDKALTVATKNETSATVTQTTLNSKYPKIVAQNAAQLFPVKEKIVIERDTIRETKTIPGKVIECPETIHKETGQKYTPTVKCPDHTYEQQTIKEQQTHIIETIHRARVLELEKQELQDSLTVVNTKLSQAEQEKKALQKENRTYFWGLIIAGFVVAGLIVIKFLKPF